MRSLRHHAGTLAALVLCLVGGWGAHSLIERQFSASVEAAERAARAEALSGAAALANVVERTLEAVTTLHVLGAMLDGAVGASSEQGKQLIKRYLQETTAARRFATLQLAIIDAGGRLEWSTVPDFQQIDLSDREHFRVHRDGRRDPFVSSPLIGRASGAWSVQLTRPLHDVAGNFDGVVVVSLDPEHLSRDLAGVTMSAGSLATLLRDDGTVLARNEQAASFIGSNAETTRRRLQESQPADGTDGVVLLGETGRSSDLALIAVRRIAGWPLAVAFEVSRRSDLDRAERRRLESRIALLTGLVVMLGAGLLIDAQWARRAARKAAAQAEASRREMLDLLEALPGATYRGALAEDGSWRRLQFSSAFERLFPLWQSSPAAAGPTMHDAARSTDERIAFRTQIVTVGEAVAEYPLHLATGSIAWVRDQARRVNGSSGDAVEIVGIVSNITEERLVKAKALSSAKLATLGEMATGVAHELSQPCAAIGLAADIALLELGRDSPDAMRRASMRLEDIVRQTMRMREVIDHFRIFSRHDVRHDVMEADQFAPDAAVHGALTIARGALIGCGVAIELDLEPDLPAVRGSLVPFEQVLVNLLVNARDAMTGVPPEARRVQVTARRHPDRRRVVIEVRDFGHGIREELLARVFEPFFTTKPPGEGTGLGLAISYGIVRSVDGAIDIGNHPGGGAVATLTLLPAEPAAGSQDNAQL